MKKNIIKVCTVAFAICCFQILNPSIALAQAESTASLVNEKCTQCADFKNAKDTENYGKNNCRIFQALCDLNIDKNTIIIQSDENTLSTTNEAISVIGGTKANLMFYIEGATEADYQLRPKVTFVDSEGKEIAESKAVNFQQYIFNEQKKLYSVRGIEQIKGFKSNESMILVTEVELPESMGKPVFIKVDLIIKNPLTAITKTIKTYYKQIKL